MSINQPINKPAPQPITHNVAKLEKCRQRETAVKLKLQLFELLRICFTKNRNNWSLLSFKTITLSKAIGSRFHAERFGRGRPGYMSIRNANTVEYV